MSDKAIEILMPPVVAEELPIRENLHIYLAIGQSNMAGRAPIEKQDEKIIGDNVLLFNDSEDGQWERAQPWTRNGRMEGLNRYSNVIYPKRYQGLNMAFYFADVLKDKVDEGVYVGIVSNARGETSVAQWKKSCTEILPDSDYNLFDNTVIRMKKALKSGVFKGIIWHQGEGDRENDNYLNDLNELITDLRRELGDAPFIAGEIAKYLTDHELFNNRLSNISKVIENSDYVKIPDGCMSLSDGIHLDSEAQRAYGRSYAQKMIDLHDHNNRRLT